MVMVMVNVDLYNAVSRSIYCAVHASFQGIVKFSSHDWMRHSPAVHEGRQAKISRQSDPAQRRFVA